ncbi:MAG: anti-sigma factor antagonist [Bacilli bacterium]|nr:anti-sigma factor antagonist [Bacilli bacterium]
MDITFNKTDKELIILAPERIDTTNANEVDVKINEILSTQGDGLPLVIDCSNLTYISSVGLRVVLKIKKVQDNLRLVCVSSEVYDIFSMTGFTEIIDVEKALREISIEGCPIIGEGYYGKVYRLSPDTIVKHYFRGNPVDDIERERNNAKTAFLLGIPTAISYDVVKIKEGGYGAVYECIDAKSLKSLIEENPEKLEDYENIIANLLRQLNRTKVVGTDLPSAKKVAYAWADEIKGFFDPEINSKIIMLIDSIPNDDYLVHGDCHVKNIFLLNGEAILIDMDSLSVGHAIFEYNSLFQTYVAYEEDDPGNLERFFGLKGEVCNKLFYNVLRKVYSDKNDEEYQDILDKISCLSYIHFLAKIIRNHQDTPARVTHTIEKIKKYCSELFTLAY